MPTTTTRLGLDKPAYNEAADIAVLNTNFDDIDAAVGLKVVTSTTRPATPWNGQIIFETDTNQSLMWDAAASAWKYVGGAAIVCTSTTRPASPLNGQIIYETDTRRVLVYSTAATAWRVPFLEYSVADFTALAALTGMVSGNTAFVTEGAITMVYDGAAWVQQNVARFASSSARDTAYAKASAAYRIQGVQVYQTDTNTYWNYFNTYNASTNVGGAATAGWYLEEGTVVFAGKRSNTSLSLTNAAYTNVSVNTFSTIGGTTNTDTVQISSATIPATFTVRKAGWYTLAISTITSAFSSTAGTQRNVSANRNSATSGTNQLMNVSNTNIAGGQPFSATNTCLLAADDVIRFWVYQDSGGSATNNDINISITWLRPASV